MISISKRFRKYMAILIAIGMLQFSPFSSFAGQQETSEQVNQISTFYESWKQNYVVQDTYVTDETQYYIWYSGETYAGEETSVPVTVSEAHGYGMLITVCMADYDTQAQEIFDGMVRFYLAHPSSIGSHLMSWQQCDNGVALIDGADDGEMVGGACDSASDGDMDIAYALLLADKIWGSTEEMPYQSLAFDMICDIMTYEVNQTAWTVGLGDWIYGSESDDIYYNAVRTSDFILSYFPIFAEVTGDDRWLNVYESTNTIIADMLEQYPTGLLPDFLVSDGMGGYTSAPENFLEDITDGEYAYNSCRTPWRIGADALISGNKTAEKTAKAVSEFMKQVSDGDPWGIVAGYTLEGEQTADYSDLCFLAPVLIAAKCSDDELWESEVRACIMDYGEDTYYGDSIRMLCLIVDADLWIVVEEDDCFIRGDLNMDDTITLADLAFLLQYLLGNRTLTENQALAADCTENGSVDGMDAARLRQIIWEDCNAKTFDVY